MKKCTLAHFGSIWAHLGPLAPPPRGAAWAVDGWLGGDGGGGGKGWLGSQRCQIGGAQASAEWIWCQRAGGRSSSLLSPQGAYWYITWSVVWWADICTGKRGVVFFCQSAGLTR